MSVALLFLLAPAAVRIEPASSGGNLLAAAFRGSAVVRTRPAPSKHRASSSGLFLDADGGDPSGTPRSSFEARERRGSPPPAQSRHPESRTGPGAPPAPAPRSVRVERMPRLPVWPVWAGVIDFFVGWIFGPEAGSKLEQHVLGGRVCPMQLDGTSTSPFLLLVHHHHNFWKWDAIFRKLSSFVLPEGFPAHPHRGFTTLTYFLPDDGAGGGGGDRIGGGGGFVHRDSIGVKQTYGSAGSYEHQAQWLFTGRGMLHEEMFDLVQNDFGEPKPRYNPRYELYQLWVNVPGSRKLDPPRVQLLREAQGDGHGDEDEDAMPFVAATKTIVDPDTGERRTTTSGVVVIAGSYRPYEDRNSEQVERFESRAEPLHSDLSILHVSVEETARTAVGTPTTTTRNWEGSCSPGWTYDIPAGHETLIVYVRKGSCTMETTTVMPDGTTSSRSPPADVPIHSTVFVERDDPTTTAAASRERLVVRPKDLDDPIDLLILSGRPLYGGDSGSTFVEPVAMQGSMVMNNNAQIQQAYADYQYGQMGVPWDHTLEDDEWTEHVRLTKPRTPAQRAARQQD